MSDTALTDRDRVAALFRHAPGADRLGDATPGEIADAVLTALAPARQVLGTTDHQPETAPTDRDVEVEQLRAENARLRGLLWTKYGATPHHMADEAQQPEAEAASPQPPRTLAKLCEQHRPVLEPDPTARVDGQYLVSCKACDGGHQQIVRTGDPIPECRFWIMGKAYGYVTDTPAPTEKRPETGLPAEQPCTDPRHIGAIREQLGCNGPDPATQAAADQQPETEVAPECSAGLLPATDAAVDRCVRRGKHDSHVTAAGVRWGSGSEGEQPR